MLRWGSQGRVKINLPAMLMYPDVDCRRIDLLRRPRLISSAGVRSGVLPWLENPGQGTGESRQHVFAEKRAVGRDDLFRPVGAVDPGEFPDRVDNPHQAGSCTQPVTDLGEHLTGTVVRRQDLDHQVG